MIVMPYHLSDFSVIVPEIIVAIFMAILFVVDLISKKKKILSTISIIGYLTALLYSIVNFWPAIQKFGFVGQVFIDQAGNFINIIITATAVLAVLMSRDFLDREDVNDGEYYVIMAASVISMQFLASTHNLIIIFLSVETLSIAMYILTGFFKDKEKSSEAAMKYFIFGAFASTFLVVGIALFYIYTGSVEFSQIAKADPKNLIFIVAFLMVMVGISFKIAAFPFHSWTPDVYEGAPTPVSAFMSVAPKAAALIVLIRFLSVAVPTIMPTWQHLLWILAVFTMFFGNTVALLQKDLKRLLGYSSIAHVGYMLIGIIAYSALGNAGVLFYLFGYVFTNMGAFAVCEYISKKGSEDSSIKNLRGIGYKYPLAGAAMAFFMLSLTGIPPTVGFVGKFYLFSAAIDAHFYWLVVLGVINSAISAYFYLSVVVEIYMKGDMRESSVRFNSLALKYVIAIGIAGTLIFGILPSLPFNAAMSAVGLL
ncbi:MAG: NADH-quinone oxidoreductase subunit N [bacterium]|nr:MAG: NADH-quinone oxidoreductase subunit N [bacterium]